MMRERPARLLLDGPDDAHPLGVVLAPAVGEVEPCGVHARVHERSHPVERGRGRPDRGDDLRAPLPLARHGLRLPSRAAARSQRVSRPNAAQPG